MTYLTKSFEKVKKEIFIDRLLFLPFGKISYTSSHGVLRDPIFSTFAANWVNMFVKLGQWANVCAWKCLYLFVRFLSPVRLLKQWKDMCSACIFRPRRFSLTKRGQEWKQKHKFVQFSSMHSAHFAFRVHLRICVEDNVQRFQRRLMAARDIEPQVSQQLVLKVYIFLRFWS